MNGKGIGNFLRVATAAPETPWLADKDWRSGTILDSNRRTGPVMALIAVLVNLLTVPIAVPVWHKVVDEGETAAAFGFVFPLVGLLTLIWAVRKNLCLVFHGVSEFEISNGRGIAGETLAGVVRNRRKKKPMAHLVATLRCIRKVSSGSGESASSYTTVLWEGKQEFRHGAVTLADGVPIEIAIPRFLPSSDDSTSDSTVSWVLEAAAPARPVRLVAEFRVPVFRR